MVHFVLLFNMLKKLTVQSKSSQQGILEGSKMVFQKKNFYKHIIMQYVPPRILHSFS